MKKNKATDRQNVAPRKRSFLRTYGLATWLALATLIGIAASRYLPEYRSDLTQINFVLGGMTAAATAMSYAYRNRDPMNYVTEES